MLPGVGCRIRPASVRLTRGLPSLSDRDHRVSSVSRPGQNNSDGDRVRVPTGRRLLYCWKLLLLIIEVIEVLPFWVLKLYWSTLDDQLHKSRSPLHAYFTYFTFIILCLKLVLQIVSLLVNFLLNLFKNFALFPI